MCCQYETGFWFRCSVAAGLVAIWRWQYTNAEDIFFNCLDGVGVNLTIDINGVPHRALGIFRSFAKDGQKALIGLPHADLALVMHEGLSAFDAGLQIKVDCKPRARANSRARQSTQAQRGEFS